MNNVIRRAVSHPALLLSGAVIRGLFEFIALQRSRKVGFADRGKRRNH